MLNGQNGIGYPNQAVADNDQGMTLYTKDEAAGVGDFIAHSDNIRGAEYCDLAARQDLLLEIDTAGWHATPDNSFYNELVVEAGRLSILNGGKRVDISYGEKPGVAFAE